MHNYDTTTLHKQNADLMAEVAALREQLNNATDWAHAALDRSAKLELERNVLRTQLSEARHAIRFAVSLLGPEYCDENKPLNVLRRVLEGNGSR